VRKVAAVDARTPTGLVVVPLVQAQVLGPLRFRLRALHDQRVNGRGDQLGVRDVGPGDHDGQRAAVLLDP
jgi:hypothetical protein